MSLEVTTKFFDRHLKFEDLSSHFEKDVKFFKLNQVHGNDVVVVNSTNLNQSFKADGAVTTLPHLALTIHTADCLPLLAYGNDVIGACHGGWRGVSADIIENWIAKMGSLGAKKESIKVLIGPAIGVCHFEVGKDVAAQIMTATNIPVKFLDSVKKSHSDSGKEYIDLKEVARYKLLRLGIQSSSIEISPKCTHCDADHYFSYRRDGAKGSRMEAVIVKSQR